MNEPVTKTKKAPPARFASKKPAESAIYNEDAPIKPAVKNLDDLPIGGAKSA